MPPGPGSLLDQLFDPIHDGSSLADTVAQRIGEAIVAGVIGDGDQLPSEERLASDFGISTITLRSALTILRDRELVVTRRGRNGGSFAQLPTAAFERAARERLRSVSLVELRDLGEEQAAIAGSSAALAARRATPENLTRLDHLVASLTDDDAVVDIARSDSRFHIEVGVSAQSERFTRRQVVMQAEYVDLLWLDTSEDHRARCIAQHRGILSAIRAEEPTVARQRAEEHTRTDFRRLVELHLEAE